MRAESRPPHNPGPGSDLLESDAEKLSSTDNEEEEGQENGEMRCTCTDFKMSVMFISIVRHILMPDFVSNLVFFLLAPFSSFHFQTIPLCHPVSSSSHVQTMDL